MRRLNTQATAQAGTQSSVGPAVDTTSRGALTARAATLLRAGPVLLALLPPALWLLWAWLQGGMHPAPHGVAAHLGSSGLASVAGISAGAAAALWWWGLRPALRQLQAAEAQLAAQDQRDPLTGLLNRDGLRAALRHALLRRQQKNRTVGVVVIDLDRFHLVNDSMGQPAGDDVLRTAAERIRSVLRGRDLLARFSADRFVVLINGHASAQMLDVMARNLLRAFEPACRVAGRDMVLSPSVGSATTDTADSGAENIADSMDRLLKCAELALRAAKAAGGGSHQHFEPALLAQHDLWLDMEHRLRHTLQGSGFALAYQAIVHAESHQVMAVEALLRWPEPGRPGVSPAEFVPVLEQTGLIVPVGRWVLHEACRQGLKWLSQGAHGLTLSVNVSPRQFAESNFTATVAAVLAQTGFPANRLQIEVTEGLLLAPSSDTLRKLDELVSAGIRLAVDDFGMGQSSLAYLKTFPLHALKIDRMFVSDLHEKGQVCERDRALARAIVELGHSLGLKVTAEGVETPEQAQILQELGCDALQGFLFSRPLPAPEFRKMLAQRGAVNSGGKPSPQWSDTMAGLEQSV